MPTPIVDAAPIVIVGTETYPNPVLVTSILSIDLVVELTNAVPIAVTPPAGAAVNVTLGFSESVSYTHLTLPTIE